MADFRAGMDPFFIFPEEVWDFILDLVEDSQDAWNLLKAFPQLDTNVALQKKKHFWLFGLVIPHLIQWKVSSWIKEKDLLNCRQVCRKWSSAVDGFLEGQPQLRAYHPESEGEGQLLPGRFHWNVKGQKGYRFEDIFFGGTHLNITDYFSGTPGAPPEHPPRKFLLDMEAHPPERSPFLSRALSISIWDDEDDDDLEGVESTDFANDLLSLHQKFGGHVWFYKVNFEWDTLGASRLIENIPYLPNLKLLHLVVDDEDDDDDTPPRPPPDEANVKKLLEQLGKGLPALPFLETLLLEECPRPFSQFLISRFAAQIRRLDLKMGMWKEEYSKLFPNLTEFNVMDYHMPPVGNGNQMKNILLSLEAPQLSKLQVQFYYVGDELVGSCPFVIEDEVFCWLKRFPNLKFLGLGSGCRALHLIEKGSLDPQKDMNSSLQFLAIRTSFDMNYNFLRCLPSLQHLELHVPSKPFVIDLSTNPVVKILEEIQTASMYQSNVWELLPNLRTVTLVVDNNYGMISESVSYAFNRERYEFERRLSNGPAVDRGGDDHALAPLRKDVIGFLQEQLEKRRRYRERDRFWDSDDEEEESELDDWDLNFEDDIDEEAEDEEVDGEGDEEEDFVEDEDDAEGAVDEEGSEDEDEDNDEDEDDEESDEDNDEDGEVAEGQDEDYADEYDDSEEIEN